MQLRAIDIAVRLSLILCLGFSLEACSSKTDSKKKKVSDESSDSESGAGDIQAQVEVLLERAKKTGGGKALAEEIESAQSLIDSATALQDKGKNDLADKKFKSARTKLEAILADHAKVADAQKKVEADQKAAEAAKKQADAAKASTLAADTYKSAVDAQKKGAELLAKASIATVNQAKAQFTQAKELFDEATRMSKENEGLKTRADNEMKILIAKKEEGKTKGVPEKAGSDWNLAEQGLRDAEDQMQRGDYASAFETIRQATGQFQAAFDAAKQNDDIAKADEDRSQREKDALAADQVKAKSAQKPTDAEPEVVKVAPPKAGKAGDKGGAKVPSGSIELPEDIDPLSDAFKQELDAEDEEFLAENWQKLSNSGQLEYDPATAAVSIDYGEGISVQKDMIPIEPLKKDFISFKPPVMPRQTQLTPEEKKKFAPYSFSGNTQGFIALPVPLRFYVRVEYYMQVLTMDQTCSFGVALMFDRSKGGYMTDWMKTGTTKQLGTKGVPPKFLKSANDWFNKLNQIPMLVEYRMTDAKTGRLRNVYNNDETATERDDKLTVDVPTIAYQRGIVGFKWSRVKFQVVELKITGILDKQEAVDMLRTKLKMKKEKKKSPAPAGKDGAGKAPATSGDGETEGGSADATKKGAGGASGGGFDF